MKNPPRSGRQTSARAGAALAALLLAGALAACTSGGGTPQASASRQASASGQASAAADASGLPRGVQQATDVPAEVPNVPALRGGVTIAECAAAAGGWKASGTARNPGSKQADYTITVFFTTDHGTVIGTGMTKVSIDAGAKASWAVTAKLTPAPNTRCVLRGVG